MNYSSRSIVVLGLLAAALFVLAPSSRVQAQEVQITGPLAGAPAVRRMRIYRDGRLQVKPTFAVTLQDEYVRTGFVGVQAQYHFTDWLGVGAFFQYGLLDIETGLTGDINGDGGRVGGQVTNNNRLSMPCANSRSTAACNQYGGKFSEQIGRLNYLAGAQLTFIPLRGKLGLFEALFVDTDFYVFAGVAAVSVEERADVKKTRDPSTGLLTTVCDSDSQACVESQLKRATRTAIAPTFGVGLSIYLTNFMGLTLEYRAVPFAWNTSGTDERGMNRSGRDDSGGDFPDGEIDEDDRVFHFNQIFNLGLSFYLPFTNEVTE